MTALAGVLELHRQSFKHCEFAKGDESDLFQIFNNFALRHHNQRQKAEHGDEYLDWIFWTALSVIQLLQQLDASGP